MDLNQYSSGSVCSRSFSGLHVWALPRYPEYNGEHQSGLALSLRAREHTGPFIQALGQREREIDSGDPVRQDEHGAFWNVTSVPEWKDGRKGEGRRIQQRSEPSTEARGKTQALENVEWTFTKTFIVRNVNLSVFWGHLNHSLFFSYLAEKNINGFMFFFFCLNNHFNISGLRSSSHILTNPMRLMLDSMWRSWEHWASSSLSTLVASMLIWYATLAKDWVAKAFVSSSALPESPSACKTQSQRKQFFTFHRFWVHFYVLVKN